MFQLKFDFRPRRHEKPFDLHKSLRDLKLYAFETVSTVFVLLLLADFTIKEVHPIIISIWSSLHTP